MNIEPNRLKHATQKPLKLKASKRPLEVLDVNDNRWLSLDIVVAPAQNGEYSVCIVPLFAHFSTVDLVKDDYFQWLRSQLTRPLWHEALQSLGLPTPKTHEFMNYQARLLRKHFPVPAPRVAETLMASLPPFHRDKFQTMISKAGLCPPKRSMLPVTFVSGIDFLKDQRLVSRALVAHDAEEVTFTPRAIRLLKWIQSTLSTIDNAVAERRFVAFAAADYYHSSSRDALCSSLGRGRSVTSTKTWEAFIGKWSSHHSSVSQNPAHLVDLDHTEISEIYHGYSKTGLNLKDSYVNIESVSQCSGSLEFFLMSGREKSHFRGFFALLHNLILERCVKVQADNLTPAEKVSALLARSRKNGLFSAYRSTQPVEQMHNAVQILVTHHRSEVFVVPAWRKIGAPTGKKSLNTPEQFETLDSFKSTNSSGLSDMRVGRDNGVVASGAISHAIAQTLAMVGREPKALARTSLFFEGRWEFSEADFHEFPKDSLSVENLNNNYRSLDHFLALTVGSNVCEVAPLTAVNRLFPCFDQGIPVLDFGECLLSARVGIRCELSHEDNTTAAAQDFIAALKSGGAKSFAHMRTLIAPLKDQLSFTPTPYFEIDGQEILESEWLNATKLKNGYFKFSSGSLIPGEQYQKLLDQYLLRKRVLAKYKNLSVTQLWTMHRDVSGESLEQSLSPGDYLKQLDLSVSTLWSKVDTDIRQAITEHFIEKKIGSFSQTLRPYQRDGASWLFMRALLGYGACLADEMGLGKTLQAIALMKLLQSDDFRVLVVMPKTLIHNWRAELKRFAPDLSVSIYPEQPLDTKSTVVLTTYPRLRINIETLEQTHWNLVVLDEAHTIKNRDSATSEAAQRLKSDARIAMTGTPLENNATELWNLMDWLNVDFLGSQLSFGNYVRFARSGQDKAKLLSPLREALNPILLRRLKADPKIGLDLPPKIFQDLPVELSEVQSILYETVVQTAILATEDTSLPPLIRSSIYLRAISHLKQILCHPEVFFGDQDNAEVLADIQKDETNKIKKSVQKKCLEILKTQRKDRQIQGEHSPKLSCLCETVEALRNSARGILIFTQFRKMGEMISDSLADLGVDEWSEVPFLHGGLSTEARMKLVDTFNSQAMTRAIGDDSGEAPPILILSLKAGGLGLNLTGADNVIHYDRWWNPSIEDQATDRAHRFGQTKTVFVKTLTTEATLEESIAKIFDDKRQLAADLLGNAYESVAQISGTERGFLNLVDPRGLFIPRNRIEDGNVEDNHTEDNHTEEREIL